MHHAAGLDQDRATAVLTDVEALIAERFEGQYEASRSPAAITYSKLTPKVKSARLRKQMEAAAERTDYHEAARLQDELKRIEAEQKAQAPKAQGEWLLDRPFQVVLGLHRARSQILEYFDLAPCKALARIENETLVVEALPSFLQSLTSMSFWVDIKYWSPASVAPTAVAAVGT